MTTTESVNAARPVPSIKVAPCMTIGRLEPTIEQAENSRLDASRAQRKKQFFVIIFGSSGPPVKKVSLQSVHELTLIYRL